MAVMLVNQSKLGNCGQKAKAGDDLGKIFESEQVNVSLAFYFLRASSFRQPMVRRAFALVSTSVSFIFYMGEDHSLPFVSIKMFYHAF